MGRELTPYNAPVDWGLQVDLTAGLGALALGIGVLAREPARPRNRRFALLCLALAVWMLGVSAESIWNGDFPWHRVFLLGSCAAAPLGLHFSLVVARRRGRLAHRLLPASYAVAGVLYVLAWTPMSSGRLWNLIALPVLGLLLLAALALLYTHYRSLPRGPERTAHRLLFVAGVIAVLGGLSDFVPRDAWALPRLGATALLVFLVMVSAMLLRHRFMDVDAFLIRVLTLVLGAAAASTMLYVVVRIGDGRFFPLFVATLLVLGLAGAVGRAVVSGPRALLRSQDPLAVALLDVSRTLQDVVDVDGVWRAIEAGRAALPDDVHVEVALPSGVGPGFEVRFRSGEGSSSPPPRADDALPVLLRSERLPLTLPYLERESVESLAARRRLAREAAEQLRRLDARLVVPLLRGDDLLGWIAVGGGFADRYLTAEIAAAFLAVGNQAVACLARIRALEESRRREALAAVGEMAAGLAHEVRNPLAAIRGAAQNLSPEATDETSREMLDVIEEETERLGRVLGEFLEYARPAPPRREPVRLDELAGQALRACELAGHGLSARIEIEPGTPRVRGDPDQLRRAFENLIRNAREAAGPGGGLRVSIGRRDGGVYARFEDNGPGFEQDRATELFRPFVTTRSRGTGLGLALVHRVVVENHGGRIVAEGRPGRGASFELVLPATEDAGA